VKILERRVKELEDRVAAAETTAAFDIEIGWVSGDGTRTGSMMLSDLRRRQQERPADNERENQL
jgi:hypothetical protein